MCTTLAVWLHSSDLSYAEENLVERLHMHLLRDIVYRLKAGQSQREVARDLGLSRGTVRKYRALANAQGYLLGDCPLPDEETLQQALGPTPEPPRQSSSLEPFAEVLDHLLAQGCEMTAILARLRQDYGYTGSYSSVRRYIRRLRPDEPATTIRVSTLPGEEAVSPQGRPVTLALWASSSIRVRDLCVRPTSLWLR